MTDSEIQAGNAAERQTLLVLEAAYDVAAGLDAQRRALSRSPHPAHRQALMEAAERLVNLIMLAGQRMSDDVGPDVRGHVEGRMGELRDRLLATSGGLVADRAAAITRRAEVVIVDHGEYPIGLAAKLAVKLSELDQAVEAMGGPSHLDDDSQAKIDAARRAVAKLQCVEAEYELQEL